MKPIVFQSVDMLNLLWGVLFLSLVYFYAAKRRRIALAEFVHTASLAESCPSFRPAVRRWKSGLVLAALALLTVSLARPGWNLKPETAESRGRDVVFVLDVSKSMLAEDLAPNRLARAKLLITDCLEQLDGERVGLVAFAGRAIVKCPLTMDYGFFAMVLADASVDGIGLGGTMIGDSIRKCLSAFFGPQSKNSGDIVLISDGEDDGSFPLEAATAAAERGIRILTVGIGDAEKGSRIPIPKEEPHLLPAAGPLFGFIQPGDAPVQRSNDSGSSPPVFLMYHGQEVWTKLNADLLRQVATATPGGRFFNVGTGAIDLGIAYLQLTPTGKGGLQTRPREQYEEEFQAFLLIALIALSLEMLLSQRRPMR